MPKVKNFNRYLDAEHIISEAEGRRSREQIMLAAAAFGGNPIEAGTALGKITASGLYTKHDAAAADGSQNAVAFLYARAEPAGAGENVRAVGHVRDCEINGNKVFWKAGITGPQKAAAQANLAASGVIVRL